MGGAFNYSDVENDVPPAGQELLPIIRDNYRSRDARLDLAYGKVKLGPGGRRRAAASSCRSPSPR